MSFRARDASMLAVGALLGAVLATLLGRQRRSSSDAPPCVLAAEEEKAAFLKNLQAHLRGAVVMAMIFLGDKLGLYRTMAARDSTWTASKLGRAAGLRPRLVEEWLAQQAAAGLLDFDSATKTFSLRRARVPVLAEELSGSFFAAYATLVSACYARLPTMLAAFKGSCLAPSYDEAGDLVAEAMARLHVPEFRFHLIPNCLPTLTSSLQARLQTEDLICADVGCSGADCTLELARSFPKAVFYAYEISEPALDRARENVAKSGLSNVVVTDAKTKPVGGGPPGKDKFDFVVCYDVLHDMTDPEALMREVHEVLAPEGVWLVVDITARSDAAENIQHHPGAGTYYGFSVCLCLPSGLSADGGRGLGTLGFHPALAEEMFRQNGFSRVRSFKMPGLEKNTCFEVQL